MLGLVYSIVLSIACVTAFALLLKLALRRPVSLLWLAAAVAALIVYWIAVVGGAFLQGTFPVFEGLKWNWIGKAIAAVAVLAMIAIPGSVTRQEIGLTLRQARGSVIPALLCFSLMAALAWGTEAWLDDGSDVSGQRLLFQAIMPGLDEELFFRGVFLALMIRALADRWMLFGAKIGTAAIAVTFVFAAGHGISFDDAGFHFSAMNFFLPGVLGFGLLWMRERTGSLLLPFLAHNAINFGNSFL